MCMGCVVKLEQLDCLAKQNKIMREALQKIMNDQRNIHEPTITSSAWVSNTFKLAHDALKAVDEVSEGEK